MATIYPKDYFAQVAEQEKKANCFVLMPFDPKFKEVYDTINETLESEILNIDCKRGDDFHEAHIIGAILQGISGSEFIIADLTESNANVFYELGLAHCVKDINNVIIITQDMKFVPFDLRQFRCIQYEQSLAGANKLREELVTTFSDLLKNSFRLKLKEREKVVFVHRLTGKNNFLYQLEFESNEIGFDGIKLTIYFTQLSADGSKKELDPQFLYVGPNNPQNIQNVPWIVSLVRTGNREAIISIDKRNKN